MDHLLFWHQESKTILPLSLVMSPITNDNLSNDIFHVVTLHVLKFTDETEDME